jgi:Ulp1 family protease
LYAKHDVAAIDGGDGNLVSVIECQTPQQRNGYDCGILALGFAEALTTTINADSREEEDNDDDIINGEKEEKYYESLLQRYFDKHGGHEDFALRLRKQIGNAIRELIVPFTTIS